VQHDKKEEKHVIFLSLCRIFQNNYGKLWNFHDFATLRLCDDYGKQAKNRAIQGDRPFFFQFLVKNRVDWKRIYKFGKF